MTAQATSRPLTFSSSGFQSREMRKYLGKTSVTLIGTIFLVAFLMPFLYMLTMSLKNMAQISADNAPLWPSTQLSAEYEGQLYNIFHVPMPDGTVKDLALLEPRRNDSTFIDPNTGETIEWKGKWRTLQGVWLFDPQWQNFADAFNQIKFGILFRNTFAIAFIGMIGTLISCILVAYGFARFRVPGKGLMFTILMATIILPSQVTLIPTYAIYTMIGWNGSWLPLLVPHFFANAYNVFLLRQFFLTIPRDLDEAAMIDGASPFRILISVIIPQSWPAITAVGLFHFFWAWNDFFNPLIYLSAKPDLQPISVGLQQFNATYGQKPHLIQAGAMLALALPVVVFFVAQRVFMQGVVITGVEK